MIHPSFAFVPNPSKNTTTNLSPSPKPKNTKKTKSTTTKKPKSQKSKSRYSSNFDMQKLYLDDLGMRVSMSHLMSQHRVQMLKSKQARKSLHKP
jgi:hypothetical protein